MHYLIDGYNMLFRGKESQEGLQSQREKMLDALNEKASILGISLSIVFDAGSNEGGRARSRQEALEILFTGQGETADEYILDYISRSPHPRREVVVTSDRRLGAHIRHLSIKVMEVPEFLQWLNHACENRLRRRSQEIKPKLRPIKHLPVPPAQAPPAPPPKVPRETDQDHYQRIFETAYAELEKKEAEVKAAKQPAKKPRRPKVRKDPFQEPEEPVDREQFEMDRWLQIFEKRSKE